jgi:hypothetical protein
MGDLTLSLLDGKHRETEYVFGWGRSAEEVGMNEFRSEINCVSDLSTRHQPKSEQKYPRLLVEINERYRCDLRKCPTDERYG